MVLKNRCDTLFVLREPDEFDAEFNLQVIFGKMRAENLLVVRLAYQTWVPLPTNKIVSEHNNVVQSS